jgi:hypothetical protein
VVVAGDVPAGGTLFVDERKRGMLPLATPLRVSMGRHNLRVEIEGFEPIIAAGVEVKTGQENVAQLQAKSRQGRLHVSEKHNWVLEVEVDRKVVGVTPWSAPVAAGDHRVRLRGFMSVEALLSCEVEDAKPAAARDGARMESPAEVVKVNLYEVKRVVLGAEETDGSLRLESTPSGASVQIDGGQVVGQTPWQGRLPLGEHRLEVRAEGLSR